LAQNLGTHPGADFLETKLRNTEAIGLDIVSSEDSKTIPAERQASTDTERGAKRLMEVIVLDNGLIGRGSHSYHLAKEVIRSLSSRRIPYRLFGTKGVEKQIVAETGAIPHFGWSLYDHFGLIDILNFIHRYAIFGAKKPTWGLATTELKIVHLLNRLFKRDLARLPPDIWRSDNVIVIPGISQNQIFGLLSHLKSLPPEKRPSVICQLMFPPSWTPWNGISVHGERLYREAFDEAMPLTNRSLFFMTDNNVQHDLFLKDFAIETDWLPIPFAIGTPAVKTPPAENAPIKLGFFGYSKTEKGFHLLPETIELCRQQHQNVEFVIQIQHGMWERSTIDTEQKLRKMDGIKLLEGVMSSDDYYREMNEVDVLLLPYDPSVYGSRGSAIYTESVAAGRPVVATAMTSIGQSILHGDAEGETFETYTSAGFAAAIQGLVSRFAECKSRAMQRAAAFAQRHSGDSYVDVLLATHAKRHEG
jgi:glycosyltransferase involved in cell wall biosynthesis